MTVNKNKTEEKIPQTDNFAHKMQTCDSMRECAHFQSINCKFIDYVSLSENIHQQIYAARISDCIREQMTNSDIFPYAAHLDFVKTLHNNVNKKYWAFCDNDCFIASVSLHPVYWEQRWGEWGIYLNPVYNGKKIAKNIAGQFFDYLAQNTPIELVKAKVKTNNIRSINFHTSVGFHTVNNDGEYIFMENNLKNGYL